MVLPYYMSGTASLRIQYTWWPTPTPCPSALFGLKHLTFPFLIS
uniref:Alternative protein TXNDC17 n=1 Tax=Homo sapiens TaxID=9606 RepID=L8E9G3_HUMAN|nr:alternative protein TXNDC17 [Homo sapiens]